MYPIRLQTGAEVEQLDIVGERLQYRKLCGAGPAQGWVSLKLDGRNLLEVVI